MGLFNRNPTPAPEPRLQIPPLQPSYYEEVQASIHAYGGTDSLDDVAYGIANAVENTAHQFLGRVDGRADQRFGAEFDAHAHGDPTAADRMIDWLVAWDPITQDTIEKLLARLREVLAKPPPDA